MRISFIKYRFILAITSMFLGLGCSNKVTPELETGEITECNIFLSNLKSDYHRINNDCNIITNVTRQIDTIYTDTSGNFYIDTNYIIETSNSPNRTHQALIFDYIGNCINKSTYFVVSYEIARVNNPDFNDYYEYINQSFAPLEFYPGSYIIAGNKIRLILCWPIYGYDVVVTYKIQGFYDNKETNSIEASFRRDDFM